MKVQREKVEQAHIVQLARTLGGKEYVIGTRRRRGTRCGKCGEFVAEDQGTRQTEGLPDVLLFLPVKEYTTTGRFPGSWIFVVVECKAADGKMTPEQRELKAFCELAQVQHIVGGLDAFIAWLLQRNYITKNSVPHYRLPKAAAPA